MATTRRALVCGIDAYPSPATLSGCVNDAVAWSRALTGRGFVVDVMIDGDCTQRAILGRLLDLVTQSKPGDVLAFVFSGHGTRLRDLNGDEADGWDEALVPVDYQTGRFILDDDLRAVFSQLPAGVALTVIADSCHSGTVARFASMLPDAYPVFQKQRRAARFLPSSRELQEAHTLARASNVEAQIVGPEAVRWTTISACQASEVAYESDGQGDFTRAALAVLGASGSRLTHAGFLRRVLERLGDERAQTPHLDVPPGLERRTLVTRATGPRT